MPLSAKRRESKLTFRSWADITPRKPAVKIAGGWVTINTEHPAAYPYEIRLDRIDTPMRLLNWVHHLAEKVWMEPLDLAELIDAVCRHYGWNLHSGGNEV
jgi:hypothetical protein